MVLIRVMMLHKLSDVDKSFTIDNRKMGCGTSTRKGEPRCKLQYRKSKEFFDEIDRGGKLILFEDLILNGEALARWHPGGDKFISSLVGIRLSIRIRL